MKCAESAPSENVIDVGARHDGGDVDVREEARNIGDRHAAEK
jgi:hypothetical protein